MVDLYCDICGKTPVRAQILVEGAKLLACGSCMRSGKMLHRFEDDQEIRPAATYTVVEASEEIVEDYAKLIKAARERTGLPLGVVAERINEKESYIHAIEGGRLAPTLECAHKLEKELGVKLVEKHSATVAASDAAAPKSFSPPTLGDMVDDKRKKK